MEGAGEGPFSQVQVVARNVIPHKERNSKRCYFMKIIASLLGTRANCSLTCIFFSEYGASIQRLNLAMSATLLHHHHHHHRRHPSVPAAGTSSLRHHPHPPPAPPQAPPDPPGLLRRVASSPATATPNNVHDDGDGGGTTQIVTLHRQDKTMIFFFSFRCCFGENTYKLIDFTLQEQRCRLRRPRAGRHRARRGRAWARPLRLRRRAGVGGAPAGGMETGRGRAK